MGLRLLFLSYLCVFSGLGYAHSHSDESCAEHLAATAIPYTPRQSQPHELATAGQIFSMAELLPTLSAGSYNYVITQSGFVALSPKSLDEGVAKHKSLLHRLSEKLGREIGEIPVIAAGEMNIAFGQATLINNRSGNLQGEANRIQVAEKIFSKMGLIFTADTHRIAFDPNSKDINGHTPKGVEMDLFQLEIHRKLNGSNHSEAWRQFFMGLGKTLIPLTSKKSALDISNFLIDAAVFSNRWDGIHEITYPFIHACTVDGFEFGLYKVIEQLNRDKILIHLQNVMDFRPEARAQLAPLIEMIPN